MLVTINNFIKSRDTHYRSTFDITDHKPFTKKGVSSSYSYFMIVATGDSSIASAMKNGNIYDVSHIDKEYIKVKALFFLEGITIYEEYTTIVYGN
ncbi:MAG: hypothetical protein PF637_05445 [Spirochaetes bacterium]|nr:hypothetical protein [Spirochaetota bacterium]